MPANIGEQHDTYYCTECFRKNPLLKCTYKKSPSTTGVPKTPKTPKTPKNPKTPKTPKTPKNSKTPKTARIINSIGVRQNPRRRSTFVQERPSEVPNPSRQSTKLQKAVNYENATEEPTEEAEKVDQKPKRTAKKKNPKPEDKVTEDAQKPAVEKLFESKGTQCNMFRDWSKYVPPENSKKRGTCFTVFCQQLARSCSRYCCDECGNFTAITNVFALGLLPNMPAMKVAMGHVGLLVSRARQLIK